MVADVLAAALVAPGQFELRRYPYPQHLEPGAVLLKMVASGICGTDKHTFRGETHQYAGTEHAAATPFPVIPGHENVGSIAAIGDWRDRGRRHRHCAEGDRVVPAPIWFAGNVSSAATTLHITTAGSWRITATP